MHCLKTKAFSVSLCQQLKQTFLKMVYIIVNKYKSVLSCNFDICHGNTLVKNCLKATVVNPILYCADVAFLLGL